MYDYVPHTKTCKDVSIRMLIKTSTDFCLRDEERYLTIRYHARPFSRPLSFIKLTKISHTFFGL